jgi:hypothetical protein
MGVADEVADRRPAVLAERQLASRRGREAHLVLEAGDVDAVALPRRRGLGVGHELRDEKQTEPLGARRSADRSRQHQVGDVLEEVVAVAGGDEPLDAVEMPGAVRLLDRLGSASADVGPCVGFGEHHGGTPVTLDGQCGPMLLLLIALVEEDVHHRWAVEVEEGRR